VRGCNAVATQQECIENQRDFELIKMLIMMMMMMMMMMMIMMMMMMMMMK
jgi:hypothetical protein